MELRLFSQLPTIELDREIISFKNLNDIKIYDKCNIIVGPTKILSEGVYKILDTRGKFILIEKEEDYNKGYWVYKSHTEKSLNYIA